LPIVTDSNNNLAVCWLEISIWPAPGSEDTELGVFMGPEERSPVVRGTAREGEAEPVQFLTFELQLEAGHTDNRVQGTL
jgi:hypothetical protein